MHAKLDNIFWHAFTGEQQQLAEGGTRARRYRRGLSPILALDDPAHPDFRELATVSAPGERIYVDAWSGPVPDGWTLEHEGAMHKMVWANGVPSTPAPAGMVALGPGHAREALALAELTRPGPFGLRTMELGEYLGVFEDGQLVAMAGERAFAAGYRELSGICTRPGYTGRGLAAALTAELVRRELARGETPFLHVVATNTAAITLYRRMGFADYRTSTVRVVSRHP